MKLKAVASSIRRIPVYTARPFWIVTATLLLLVQQRDWLQSRVFYLIKSDSSGRSAAAKTRVYVITLQGVPGAAAHNEHRFDHLISNWTAMCGPSNPTGRPEDHGFEYFRCPGILSKDVVGAGLARAFGHCFDQALLDAADAARTSATEEFVIFLEDDARLYSNELCSKDFRLGLWNSTPDDAFVLLLGAWQFRNTRDVPGGRFTVSTKSYGAYGFAVPINNIAKLRDRWLWDADHPYIHAQNFPIASIDFTWYAEAERFRMQVYAAKPLLIRHSFGSGYSNTWNASNIIYPPSLNEK